MNNTIAFFDFDGTITHKDSLFQFIFFAIGTYKTLLGMCMLSPMLCAYKLKIIPNDKAKQIMLSYFFKGMQAKEFQEIAEEYALHHIHKILRPKAMQKITWHQKQGHKIVLVSASLECWLKPWCNQNNLDLIGTKLEIKDGIITGKFLTKNCYGIEKVNRIHENYTLSHYHSIYVYGDSRGDKELLKLSDKSYYKPFRD